MTKNELCTKIMMYAEGHILFQEVVDAVDAYSSASNNGNAIVSGALRALVGLSEYINNSYDFVDGDWYWKVDVEGDCPLSIEQVIANFISTE